MFCFSPSPFLQQKIVHHPQPLKGATRFTELATWRALLFLVPTVRMYTGILALLLTCSGRYGYQVSPYFTRLFFFFFFLGQIPEKHNLSGLLAQASARRLGHRVWAASACLITADSLGKPLLGWCGFAGRLIVPNQQHLCRNSRRRIKEEKTKQQTHLF